jgi:hypothetical protein
MQRTVPTPLSPTTRSFAAMHRGALRKVRSVHPGVRRARPRIARQPSAIPASACTQPKPAHVSLRRAGPQNAQIGAPVKAPEPDPLVETGQDGSRLRRQCRSRRTRTQRYALHTSLHIPLRPSHDTNGQPSYKYKLCYAGAMPPACRGSRRPCVLAPATVRPLTLARNASQPSLDAKDPSSVCEPRTIHWCTFTPHVRLAGPCPR